MQYQHREALMEPGQSLEGVRVLVTRSRHQSSELSARLRELKAEVLEVPVIEITPPDTYEPLDAALSNLAGYDWVIFASVNSVESCLSRMQALGIRTDSLSSVKLAAIGPSTAAALQRCGLAAALCPNRSIAEDLVESFPGYPNLTGLHVLWPRTNIGRTYIRDKLQEAGAKVDLVEAYKTAEPSDRATVADFLVAAIQKHELDVLTLASAQTAENLSRLICLGLSRQGTADALIPESLNKIIQSTIIVSIGPETSASARECLGRVDLEAKQFTAAGMVEAIREFFGQRT